MEISCPFCHLKRSLNESRKKIVCIGRFYRFCDKSYQQRFRCSGCGKSFSLASFHPCYRQRKRSVNPLIFHSLVSGESQRRIALLLKLNRKTVVRKMRFLGIMAYLAHQDSLNAFPPSAEVEFDDLETFEHSKLKPLSVPMLVETGSRRILGFRVGRMPAKGLLVARSLKKYGPRIDERKAMRRSLFVEIKPFLSESVVVKSDENPHYPADIKKFFPGGQHCTFKGRRGCVVGQGELKAGGFDPLFSLNHSFAMVRANVNRLFRRTWNTTKKPEHLALHIALYVLYHNQVLIRPKIKTVGDNH